MERRLDELHHAWKGLWMHALGFAEAPCVTLGRGLGAEGSGVSTESVCVRERERRRKRRRDMRPNQM